uniref:Enoyl-CoA delta isomerase 1, mitochondrial-like n=1 Tax=Saccoglossus kowalevskii TaxID=10224 RepID=A0ABM0MMT2_SACKO
SGLRLPFRCSGKAALLNKSVLPLSAAIKRGYTDSSTELLQVEKDPENEAVAILRLNRRPVNGLNKQLLNDLSITLEKLQNDKTYRGIILTSMVPNIFSAGLDITEFYQKKPEETDAFWRTLQDVFLRLYGSKLVTIAAISGHSPAGGCLLAMACDYRVMATGKYTIGLNETLLGIIAPFWFIETMKNTIGHRETEKSLQLGKLYSPEQAENIGLVDQICPPDDVLGCARKEMVKWLKIPDHARILTKQLMRNELINNLSSKRKEDIYNFTSFVQKDSIQRSLGLYLESLKKKKS